MTTSELFTDSELKKMILEVLSLLAIGNTIFKRGTKSWSIPLCPGTLSTLRLLELLTGCRLLNTVWPRDDLFTQPWLIIFIILAYPSGLTSSVYIYYTAGQPSGLSHTVSVRNWSPYKSPPCVAQELTLSENPLFFIQRWRPNHPL